MRHPLGDAYDILKAGYGQTKAEMRSPQPVHNDMSTGGRNMAGNDLNTEKPRSAPRSDARSGPNSDSYDGNPQPNDDDKAEKALRLHEDLVTRHALAYKVSRDKAGDFVRAAAPALWAKARLARGAKQAQQIRGESFSQGNVNVRQ